MRAKGIHVPRTLANMAKLFSKTGATRKRSMAMTTDRNNAAVWIGLVKPNFLK